MTLDTEFITRKLNHNRQNCKSNRRKRSRIRVYWAGKTWPGTEQMGCSPAAFKV